MKRLRAFTAFAEDLSSIPSTHGDSQLLATLVPEDSIPSDILHGYLNAHRTYIDKRVCTQRYNERKPCMFFLICGIKSLKN